MSESDANKHLSQTARLHALSGFDYSRDPLEDTQRMEVHDRRRRAREGVAQNGLPSHPEPLRERRKPSTVGERQAEASAASHARDVFADRQQELIETGIWPVYEP